MSQSPSNEQVRNVIIVGSGPGRLHRGGVRRPRLASARWSSRAR